MAHPGSAERGLRHVAVLYRGQAEYLALLADFVRATARSPGCAAAVCLPSWLSFSDTQQLTSGTPVVIFDMAELAGNPARIIPAVSSFLGSCRHRPVLLLAEPARPDRSTAEIREAVRHESLLNLAFAGAGVSISCPYDAGLPALVIEDAWRTHPVLVSDGGEHPSDRYLGPAVWPPSCETPLGRPAGASALAYEHDLRPVRQLVEQIATRAGLAAERVTDLVIATSEIAANTLRHTSRGGMVLAWQTAAEMLVQIEDTGHITDPLAGRRRPAEDLPGGQGLFLVNKVCDLVEMRSSAAGTTIRLHMGIGR